MKVSLKPKKLRKKTGVTRQELSVNKLAESSTRRRFQVQPSSRFRQRRCVDRDGVEMVWQEATETVVGRRRSIKKATTWWSDKVKQAVRKKEDMYKETLGERSDRLWETGQAPEDWQKAVIVAIQ